MATRLAASFPFTPPEGGAGPFSIAELADAFGVTHRTIRFYEDEGLISPKREGTQRIYSRRDRARLAWILRGKRVGLSLADIRGLLDLYDQPGGREKQRRLAADACRQRILALERQRADIDAVIDELSQFISEIERQGA